jgi:thiamine-phosphate pyrophosphorylase
LVDLRLLAIVGPPVVTLSDVLSASEAAVRGGVTAVQLRVKELGAARQVELARSLVARLSVPVFLNDRADVALVAGARGVHVGTDDIAPAAVREFAGDRLVIGGSVGNEAEATAALGQPLDYWSIGPVYATSTKLDAGAPIGAEHFGTLAQMAPAALPCIAIGGILAENAPEIMAAGARGVAVSAGLFATTDIERAARSLRAAVDGG